MPSISLPLHTRLAQALPASVSLTIHHITSESIPCPELFSAPPGELPESTTSESHFLSASIEDDGKPLQIFALEIYVYTTDSLTTIFVSKADSTGYLQLRKLAPGTPSPIKAITTTFLQWLVDIKRRKDTRLLLSLFARAQNQYLFPGSIENPGKHVLDDRGLIRWWCSVLDPVLLEYAGEDSEHNVHAHLTVPGLDAYETRPYFPRSPPNPLGQKPRWTADHPLQAIGKPAGLPARCYIPRFPDDPKARFVVDLDDELPDEPEDEASRRGKSPGIWKSVKSLGQFWDLMSFRQECGAGRLVGFIWAVFEPLPLVDKPFQARIEAEDTLQQEDDDDDEATTLPTPGDSQHQSLYPVPNSLLPPDLLLQTLDDGLPTPVPSSQPRPQEDEDEEAASTSKPVQSVISDRIGGKRTETGVQLSDQAYKHALLTLDRLDYANVEIAQKSTKWFLDQISENLNLDSSDWSMKIIGEAEVRANTEQATNTSSSSGAASSVNVISSGLVRRKRPIEDTTATQPEANVPQVKVLSASAVRKKPKV